MEINPIDKVQDFISQFKEYIPQIKCKSDEGYDWLEEKEDLCVVISNSENSLEIIFENEGEFTLVFGYMHSHYRSEDHGYNALCNVVTEILNIKLGAGSLFYGTEDKHCLGGKFVTQQEANQPIQQTFSFVLKRKEISNKLKAFGGEAKFVFWNNSQSKTVIIDKTI